MSRRCVAGWLVLTAALAVGCGPEPPPTDLFTEVDAGFEGIYNGALACG